MIICAVVGGLGTARDVRRVLAMSSLFATAPVDPLARPARA
jgi:hypothetical protein